MILKITMPIPIHAGAYLIVFPCDVSEIDFNLHFSIDIVLLLM